MADNDTKIVIGADVSGAMGGINQLIGSMPGLGAAVAAGFSISAVTAFVKSSVDAADAVNTLSQKIGVGATAITGWQHAAQMSNVSNEALSTSLIKLSRNIGDNSQAFAQYGIATTDASGKLLSTEQVFAKIADKMQSMPNGANKAAMAIDLLGKSGADLIPLLNEGSIGLEKFRLEAEMAGTAISDDFAKNAAEFNDHLDNMALLAKGAANAIAGALLPALNGLADVLTVTSQEKLKAYQIELANLKEEGVVRTDWQRQRIAFLETEAGKLEQVIRLEQARAALAGAGKLGDTRDARDRAGEAGSQAGAIAKYEAGKKVKTGKAGKISQDDVGPQISMGELIKRRASDEFMGPQQDDFEAKNSELFAAALNKEKQLTDIYIEGLQARAEARDFDLLTQDEQEAVRLEEKLLAENERRAAGLVSEQQFQDNINAIRFNAATKSSTQIAQIQAAAAGWENFTVKQKTEFALNMAEQLTGALAGQSRKMFEAHKVAATGQAVMNVFEGGTKALAQGGLWGAVMMAAVVAIGMAQVAKIRAQKYGGGDSGGAGGSSISLPTPQSLSSASTLSQNDIGSNPAPVAAVQGRAEVRSQVSVTLIGESIDYNTFVNKFIPIMEQASSNGALDIQVNRG